MTIKERVDIELQNLILSLQLQLPSEMRQISRSSHKLTTTNN